MLRAEFVGIINRLGLGPVEVGRVLGLTYRQVARYKAGDTIPEPIARIMRLLDRRPDLVAELMACASE